MDDECRCHAGRGHRSTGLVAADRSLQVSSQSIFIGQFEPSCDSCRAPYDLGLRRIDAKHDPERGWALSAHHASNSQRVSRQATNRVQQPPHHAHEGNSTCTQWSGNQELAEMLKKALLTKA